MLKYYDANEALYLVSLLDGETIDSVPRRQNL
jgi:hypothetical protein